MLQTKSMSIEIALRWMLQNAIDDKSTLVQVMAWCCQATSHYLSRCLSVSMSLIVPCLEHFGDIASISRFTTIFVNPSDASVSVLFDMLNSIIANRWYPCNMQVPRLYAALHLIASLQSLIICFAPFQWRFHWLTLLQLRNSWLRRMRCSHFPAEPVGLPLLRYSGIKMGKSL